MSILQHRPAVAVSACLMGQTVRYDGGHRHQGELLAALTTRLKLLPRCPELILGIPRPPVQRVRTQGGQWRVLGRDDRSLDVTEILQQEIDRQIDQLLTQPDFSGWVLKSRSPSCGAGSTPLFGPRGQPITPGDGLLVETLNRRCPGLALAEETALTTPRQQQQFVRSCQWAHALLHDTLPLEQLHARCRAWREQLSPTTRQQLQGYLTDHRRQDYSQLLLTQVSRPLPPLPGYG